MGIPVIDLSGFEEGADETRRSIANDLDRACTEVGFFSLVGHGVDDDVVLRAHDAARRFFALPLDDRLTAAKPDPSYPYGFAPFSSETLHKSLGGVTRPDLKEAYSIGPPGAPPRPHAEMTDPDERDVWAPTIWPSAMPRAPAGTRRLLRRDGATREDRDERLRPRPAPRRRVVRSFHRPPRVGVATGLLPAARGAPCRSGVPRRSPHRLRHADHPCDWTPNQVSRCSITAERGSMSTRPTVPWWSISVI